MWMPTHIQLTVQRARGLLTKGKHGTNDCFVVMSLGKEKFQTSVKEKAPPDVDWREECELTIPKQGNTAEIKLTVLHRNFLGVDEFLGQTSVTLADQDVYERPKNRWYQLHSKPDKKDTKKRGELEVRLAFTVKAAPLGSSSDLAEDRQARGSLLSLPKVSGALGGSLASLGHKKKSLRKLAASVGHKVAKAGGRRRGSSSRGTSEAGSDVGSDLGWDDAASSNADPGVISEGEEEMFGFDDDQGRRVSTTTPELHRHGQSRALVDETPLSSLSSSVQSGLSDHTHAATYEQSGEAAVRHEATVAPSPLAATESVGEDRARTGWPASARSSGRLRPAEDPHTAELSVPEPLQQHEVTVPKPIHNPDATVLESPPKPDLPPLEHPLRSKATAPKPPDKPEVTPLEPSHKHEVTLPEPAQKVETMTLPPREPNTSLLEEPRKPEILPNEPPAGNEPSVTNALFKTGPTALKPPPKVEPTYDESPHKDEARLANRARHSVDTGTARLERHKPETGTGETPETRTRTQETPETQAQQGNRSRSSMSSRKEEEVSQKQPEPATQGGGEAVTRSARGGSARLSGRLRPAEPPGRSEVRSEEVQTGELGGTMDGNPFDEPEKNPFDEPEKNPFDEPEKNPFDEPEKSLANKPGKNPFSEPEKNIVDEPEKNPFDEPEKNPFNEPEKIPFEETEKNPFEEPGNNPFDEPAEDFEVELPGVEGGVKQPKEKSKKRDKLGKMFRSLKSKKEEGISDASEKKSKKSSQAADDADSRSSADAVPPEAPSLRSVQTWAGAALPGAAPQPDPPPLNPFDEEQSIPEEGGTPSPARERPGRTANLKERLRKREKPDKGAAPTRKTPQIFRKSGNLQGGEHILEKARRQATLPRSDSVPLLPTSADAAWPRVVEGGNERLGEPGREARGPFDGVSRERLVQMVTELQTELRQATEELKRSRAQTQDMEEYLDSLLLRIMEFSPHLLQSPSKPGAGSAKYGPRGS